MAHAPNTAIVLGSAQDGGVPQLGGPTGGEPRTASSLAVIPATGPRILLDASPDLRMQAAALADALGPGEDALRPFGDVLLTHAHMGHYTGLVHFGNEALAAEGVKCHATPSLLEFLTANQPWAALFSAGHLIPVPVTVGDAFDLAGEVTVTAHAVPHRPDFSDTVGYELRFRSGKALLYLPDIDRWSEWPDARGVIEGVDVALVDATFFSSSEHPTRDLARIPHPAVEETVQLFGDIAARTRLLLTHLNWSNPLCDPESPESLLVEEAGFEVAHDGMRIDL